MSGSWPPPPPPGERRPGGPPPSPPTQLPPTQLPPSQQPTAPGWPAVPPPRAPYAAPPPGPPQGPPPGQPPYWTPGPPPGPPPRRGGAWKIVVPIVLGLVLLAGGSVAVVAYLTGSLGFGPLSRADRDAIDVLADQAGPSWADADTRECAAEALVEDERSGALVDAGVLRDDHSEITYAGEWPGALATTYVEHAFDCDSDWSDAVADHLEVGDPSCLEELGEETMVGFYVAEDLRRDDTGEAAADREAAVAGLDECYVRAAPKVTGRAQPGYRSVAFTLTTPEVEDGTATFAIDPGSASERPLEGSRFVLPTGEGGVRGCITAVTTVAYPWGTNRSVRSELCGQAQPRELRWVRLPRCAAPESAPCNSWELRSAGARRSRRRWTARSRCCPTESN